MCGIIGEYSDKVNLDSFTKRRELLYHRGPDATGLFVSANKKLVLGHKRLSIIDLSKRGNQPMEIGDCVIVYNGEVYNFKELKKEIPADYKSSSDTEVILRAYIKYGINAFKKFDGMFALCLYNKQKNQLILARDRMGIKPLYYHISKNGFQFASELQSLDVPKKINLSAVQKFIYQNYIYGDDTILKDVYKLPAGSYAVLDLNTWQFNVVPYWQPEFSNQYSNLKDSQKKLQEILRDSVKRSLISDVPIGIFLSSGPDSSLITALAKESVDEVKTFTIGFEFSSFDESKRAEIIAQKFGTKHHSIFLSKKEVLNNIPNIFNYFQEPFGDSSAINVYFLCRFARERVKVCLSGDGADELFGGYPIYYLPGIVSLYQYLPFRNIIERLVNLLPSSYGKMSFDYKLKRFVYAARYDFTRAHFYYRIMHSKGVLNQDYFKDKQDSFLEYFNKVKNEDILNRLLYVDQKTVLIDDYLVKVDRASMANSLEVRVPYLNNQVIDFSNNLSSGLKIKNFTTKYILKKILEQYLPKSLIYRKKQGFNFPIADWLKNELKDFMTGTLSKNNVNKIEFLNYSKIESIIKEHLSGRKDYNRELWGLISLVRYINKYNIKI